MFDVFDVKIIRIFCLVLSVQICNGVKEVVHHDEKYLNGIPGVKAELAHITRRFGFVDYQRINEDMISRWVDAEKNHHVNLLSWTPELWNLMAEEIPNMKGRFCTKTLNDPVLIENDVEFDEHSDNESIEIVEKEVIFLRFTKMPVTDKFVKCPITIQGQDGYFAYISLFESAENENKEEYYFILFDLFHENTKDLSNQVVVAIRTRLGANVPLVQQVKKFFKELFFLNRFKLRTKTEEDE